MLNNCYSTYTYRVNRTDDSSSWYEPGHASSTLAACFHSFSQHTDHACISAFVFTLLFCCAVASPYIWNYKGIVMIITCHAAIRMFGYNYWVEGLLARVLIQIRSTSNHTQTSTIKIVRVAMLITCSYNKSRELLVSHPNILWELWVWDCKE